MLYPFVRSVSSAGGPDTVATSGFLEQLGAAADSPVAESSTVGASHERSPSQGNTIDQEAGDVRRSDRKCAIGPPHGHDNASSAGGGDCRWPAWHARGSSRRMAGRHDRTAQGDGPEARTAERASPRHRRRRDRRGRSSRVDPPCLARRRGRRWPRRGRPPRWRCWARRSARPSPAAIWPF